MENNKEITPIGNIKKDFKLIPLMDIEPLARQVAVKWVENYGNMGFDIENKHKLASDFMNYARLYHASQLAAKEGIELVKKKYPDASTPEDQSTIEMFRKIWMDGYNSKEGKSEGEKPDCSKHKKEVAGISDMKELAEMIGDLHYETLSDFMYELSVKLLFDSVNDKNGGRVKLAENLQMAAHRIAECQLNIIHAWEISKPFMATTSIMHDLG